jgi:hypothetical protein
VSFFSARIEMLPLSGHGANKKKDSKIIAETVRKWLSEIKTMDYK